MAKDGNRNKRQRRRRKDRRKQKIPIETEGRGAVGEHERGEQVKWRLFRHSAQRCEDDLLWITANYSDDGSTFNSALSGEPRKHRTLQDTEANVQPEPDQNKTQHERQPPTPGQEL